MPNQNAQRIHEIFNNVTEMMKAVVGINDDRDLAISHNAGQYRLINRTRPENISILYKTGNAEGLSIYFSNIKISSDEDLSEIERKKNEAVEIFVNAVGYSPAKIKKAIADRRNQIRELANDI